MTTLGIGQLAGRAGVAIDAVRYYERNQRRPDGSSGYRRYGEGELKRLRFLRRARGQGQARSGTQTRRHRATSR